MQRLQDKGQQVALLLPVDPWINSRVPTSFRCKVETGLSAAGDFQTLPAVVDAQTPLIRGIIVLTR